MESIKIFDGNTGNLVTVTDRETIEKLVENFKSVYLRRTFDFGSRNGFNLLVDITVKGRDETCHFTINSERHAVRESRFYSYWGNLLLFLYEGVSQRRRELVNHNVKKERAPCRRICPQRETAETLSVAREHIGLLQGALFGESSKGRMDLYFLF